MSEGLFGPIFVPGAFRDAVSGRAWLQAMLDAEAALAVAGARAGLIPPGAAEEIRACCEAGRFDPGEIGARGRDAGNPVPALVRALTEEVSKTSEDAARHVHRGATSQDITDTAAMLVSRRSLDLILAQTDAIAAACARLAEVHRGTPMAGRTLLQQALPTTFGLKAAGWLVSILEAGRRVRGVRLNGLAVQLGGAAGTLASLGDDGLSVLREFALELGLPEAPLPWHTDRTRISFLGDALALLSGVLEKISKDVILMAQTEVGEVAEPAGEGRGGSSTLPHKRNPILSVTAAANARRVRDLTLTLSAAMPQEHERAAGAWHSEWEPLSEALALAGGAAANVREVMEGLEVRPGRMLANLDATDGMLLAENVSTVASRKLGRQKAHDLVQAACRRAVQKDRHLRDELVEDGRIREALTEGEIDAALDPAGYLGTAGAFVDRALTLYQEDAP